MKRRGAIIGFALLLVFSLLFAAESLTPAAKKAMGIVKKAVKFYQDKGKGPALKAFNNPKGQFRDGEYYIFVFDFEGNCIARSDGNTNLIGKNMLAMQDPDGKLYIKEMVDTAKEKQSGWVEYKRSNPVSKKIEDKSSYIEKVGDIWLGCGFYK